MKGKINSIWPWWLIGEISDKVATIKKNEQKTGHRVSESVVGTRRDDDPSNRLLQTDFFEGEE